MTQPKCVLKYILFSSFYFFFFYSLIIPSWKYTPISHIFRILLSYLFFFSILILLSVFPISVCLPSEIQSFFYSFFSLSPSAFTFIFILFPIFSLASNFHVFFFFSLNILKTFSFYFWLSSISFFYLSRSFCVLPNPALLNFSISDIFSLVSYWQMCLERTRKNETSGTIHKARITTNSYFIKLSKNDWENAIYWISFASNNTPPQPSTNPPQSTDLILFTSQEFCQCFS